MPIHVRANPGDYAEACLLPGDPLRAKYIAETFFDDIVQRNGERGLLGYTGTYNGKPVSVQASGMGCPSAAIVIEELAQLGVKQIIRVGTCGGLQPELAMGDLLIAMSSTPADSTASHYVPVSHMHRPPTSRSSTKLSIRRSTWGSPSAWGRSCRATSSTSPIPTSSGDGRSAASSQSRWRLRCCSPSEHCGSSRPGAC